MCVYVRVRARAYGLSASVFARACIYVLADVLIFDFLIFTTKIIKMFHRVWSVAKRAVVLWSVAKSILLLFMASDVGDIFVAKGLMYL